MLSREFDVEEYVRVRSEESFEDGMKLGEAKGEARGVIKGMHKLAEKLAEEYNDKGMELPDSIRRYLEND